jgi:hypothetical protein
MTTKKPPFKKKLAINFIKGKYPIGTEVFDDCRSGSFTVRKNSVFEAFEFEYNEESQPETPDEDWIDFTVRAPGKHSEVWGLKTYERGYVFK